MPPVALRFCDNPAILATRAKYTTTPPEGPASAPLAVCFTALRFLRTGWPAAQGGRRRLQERRHRGLLRQGATAGRTALLRRTQSSAGREGRNEGFQVLQRGIRQRGGRIAGHALLARAHHPRHLGVGG